MSAVVTEKGVIRTRLAIITGGAWASSFCRQIGVRFPQATVRQSIVAVATDGKALPGAFYSKLVAGHVDARLHVWEGGRHAFYDERVPEAREVYDVVGAFFTERLR